MIFVILFVVWVSDLIPYKIPLTISVKCTIFPCMMLSVLFNKHRKYLLGKHTDRTPHIQPYNRQKCTKTHNHTWKQGQEQIHKTGPRQAQIQTLIMHKGQEMQGAWSQEFKYGLTLAKQLQGERVLLFLSLMQYHWEFITNVFHLHIPWKKRCES